MVSLRQALLLDGAHGIPRLDEVTQGHVHVAVALQFTLKIDGEENKMVGGFSQSVFFMGEGGLSSRKGEGWHSEHLIR